MASSSFRTGACRSFRTSASSSGTRSCPRGRHRDGAAERRDRSTTRQAACSGRRLFLTLTHFHPEHGYGAQAFVDEAVTVYNRAQLEELRVEGRRLPRALQDVRRRGGGASSRTSSSSSPRSSTTGPPSSTSAGVARSFATGGAGTHWATRPFSFREQRVLFTGDLVEERCFAIFPWFPPDDIDVDGHRWIEVLRELERLDPAVVVPGHGDVGGVEVIVAAREYIEQLRDETVRLARRRSVGGRGRRRARPGVPRAPSRLGAAGVDRLRRALLLHGPHARGIRAHLTRCGERRGIPQRQRDPQAFRRRPRAARRRPRRPPRRGAQPGRGQRLREVDAAEHPLRPGRAGCGDDHAGRGAGQVPRSGACARAPGSRPSRRRRRLSPSSRSPRTSCSARGRCGAGSASTGGRAAGARPRSRSSSGRSSRSTTRSPTCRPTSSSSSRSRARSR